jgi:biopolymer transport protein TolQ
MFELFGRKLVPWALSSSDIAMGVRGDVWDLILHSGPVVKLVLLILVLLSICCWGIVLFKFIIMRSAIRESETFLNAFWEGGGLPQTYQIAKRLEQSPLAEIFRSGYLELQKLLNIKREQAQQEAPSEAALAYGAFSGIESIKRALDQAAIAEQTRLEKNLTFLATTGNTAPFIGLFGTVWGIMDAFRQIGIRGSASLATVAPGISEALIATAFGLVAAIPAVVAYNYFMSKARMISAEMDNFGSEFLNIIQRHLETS